MKSIMSTDLYIFSLASWIDELTRDKIYIKYCFCIIVKNRICVFNNVTIFFFFVKCKCYHVREHAYSWIVNILRRIKTYRQPLLTSYNAFLVGIPECYCTFLAMEVKRFFKQNMKVLGMINTFLDDGTEAKGAFL